MLFDVNKSRLRGFISDLERFLSQRPGAGCLVSGREIRFGKEVFYQWGTIEMKKIIIKRIIMTILLVLFGLSFIYWSHLFYSGRYKPIELKYLGSADGTGGVSSYVAEQRRNFMYCGFGYEIFDFEMIDDWNLHNFDFNLELQESKKYIMSIGVPIERLEYLDHYSRATYSKDKIQQGRFYFYEIDNISITKWGNWNLNGNLRW